MSTPVLAQQWMGLEPSSQTVIAVQTSINEQDTSAHSLSLSSTLGEQFNLSANLVKNTLKDDTKTFESALYFVQLSFLANDDIELHIAQQFEGETQQLEANTTLFQVDYSPYPWGISLHYSQGEVTIYTRQNPLIRRQVPTQFSSDYNSSGLTFNVWFDDFTLSLHHSQYEYDKNISLLSNNLLLQLIIKPEAFLHSSILIAQEQRISLNVAFNERSLELHISAFTSAVDASTINIARLDWTETISSSTQLLVGVSQTLVDDGPWALSLGVEWTF